jgi:hypothetical protein
MLTCTRSLMNRGTILVVIAAPHHVEHVAERPLADLAPDAAAIDLPDLEVPARGRGLHGVNAGNFRQRTSGCCFALCCGAHETCRTTASTHDDPLTAASPDGGDARGSLILESSQLPVKGEPMTSGRQTNRT